jgi:hypothetical protein
MSGPDDLLSDVNQIRKSANGTQNQDYISSYILDEGDIFFFYRPKVAPREVSGIDSQ